jgi:hypothetical protein
MQTNGLDEVLHGLPHAAIVIHDEHGRNAW